jgi:hypothetical protein
VLLDPGLKQPEDVLHHILGVPDSEFLMTIMPSKSLRLLLEDILAGLALPDSLFTLGLYAMVNGGSILVSGDRCEGIDDLDDSIF